MRGHWSDYAAPPVYLTREPPRSGVRFSREELRQLAVAILALSAAMTLLIVLGYQREGLLDPDALPLLVSVSFATSLVAVATGVGLHEIAHKVVAQRYGHWAEFRYNPMGLVLAFVFAAVGFLYGAPGATWISGTVTDEQNGRISAAGPLTNIVLGVGFLGILTTLGTVVTRRTANGGAVLPRRAVRIPDHYVDRARPDRTRAAVATLLSWPAVIRAEKPGGWPRNRPIGTGRTLPG